MGFQKGKLVKMSQVVWIIVRSVQTKPLRSNKTLTGQLAAPPSLDSSFVAFGEKQVRISSGLADEQRPRPPSHCPTANCW